MYLLSKLKLRHFLIVCIGAIIIFLPLHDVIKYVFVAASRTQVHLSQTYYQKQIEELKKSNLTLSVQLKEYQSLAQENERLRSVLALTSSNETTLLAADIIAFSPTTWRRFAVLNKGKEHGVHKGYYAIDEKGNLLGKVTDVEEKTSELIFVDDPDFTASVFVGKHGYGLLKGNLIGAKLLYIEDGEHLQTNDKVWMRIPSLKSDIDIGTIKHIRKNENSLFWDIDVTLFTGNTFFDRVYLVQ